MTSQSNIPYPVGTEGNWVTMEEPIRFRFPMAADYKGDINKYKVKKDVNVIGQMPFGEDILQGPPCSPQPVCRLWEGGGDPEDTPDADEEEAMPAPLLLLTWTLPSRSQLKKDLKRQAGEAFLFDGVSLSEGRHEDQAPLNECPP